MPASVSLDHLHILYRADIGLLVCRWMRQPSRTELEQGYAAILDAAVTHGCARWLIDVRRRDTAFQDATPWMQADFFPRVAARMPETVLLAYLFAPSHLAELEADPAVPSLSYFDGRPYRVQRFIQEQDAMSWLQVGAPPVTASAPASR
ncbi:hypothetical protein LJY25_05715 [Hymenobacter sp. BT175]|uniref:hypothetical protein n=1 Tax=Hymenobacter translucens TaxID=2886507 RepID=UPI001D0E7A5E|nr:hypothetical protein [Hymenobacter translucens]MCC2545933.1 hypothetical protein [Hymenobacter translucens]